MKNSIIVMLVFLCLMLQAEESINSYGTDNQPGGSWLIHGGTTYQTSDGCFIPNNDEYTKMQTILSSWNVRKNHEIKGNLNDPYSYWIRLWGQK